MASCKLVDTIEVVPLSNVAISETVVGFNLSSTPNCSQLVFVRYKMPYGLFVIIIIFY